MQEELARLIETARIQNVLRRHARGVRTIKLQEDGRSPDERCNNPGR